MALINTTTTGILGTTVYGDGQGALTVQKDGVTQAIITNAPAFSVYQTSGQSISNTTWTKIAFQVKSFDVTNNFDLTNNRFTPNISGYYLVCSQVIFAATTQWSTSNIRKNGTGAIYGTNVLGTPNGQSSTANQIIYMNGTTDYLELFSYQSVGSTQTTLTGGEYTWFSACLLRAV